jgi:uncharacterized protein YegL
MERKGRKTMPADRVTSKNPWHVVLVLDDSASMSSGPAQEVGKAVEAMIEEMRVISSGTKPYFRVSIVRFGSRAETLSEYVNEQAIDLSLVASLVGGSGSTNAASALNEVVRILQDHSGEPTDFNPYVFFLSDGAPDDSQLALNAGVTLKALTLPSGVPRLVTIGFGSVNDAFMSSLASNSELYKKLKDVREVTKLFPQIGTIAQSQVGVQGVDQAIMNL